MKAKDKTIHKLKLIFEKYLGNSFIKADLKMNLVTEVEEPFLFYGFIKGFSKINIDLKEKDINKFLKIDNESTKEYSESIFEEVEAKTVKLIPQTFLEL